MKYKVHIAYITPEGKVIPAGIYDASEIDVAIARQRTIITTADANSFSTVSPSSEAVIEIENRVVKTVDAGVLENNENLFPVDDFSSTDEVKNIKISPTQTTVAINYLKINTASSEEIQKLKYVGKATAERVLAARSVKPFESYNDVNQRVPLPKQKRWEDISVIAFNEVKLIDNESTISFI